MLVLGAFIFASWIWTKKKVPKTLFYYDVTSEMKRDMKEAIGRLVGKDAGYTFSYRSNPSHITIVDGKKRNSLEGFNRDLCLRIDIQNCFERTVENKKRKFANVQIQLNGVRKRPTTIAQVNFECGVNIPEESIRRAFEKSWKEKTILFVIQIVTFVNL